uniref:Orf221 n=1 Tax=Monoblepharella sp. JEL15 TaxID=224130 RepID=Q85MB5_9FUNG|nr:orf221 [Monoblepharella sp. JEL15]AAO64967.1 orf221 [Monoblepharella sp. JEL15]
MNNSDFVLLSLGPISASLSDEQRDAVIGTMLGDASMEYSGTKNPRLRFEQLYPDRESYINSLYILFKDFTGTPPRIVERKPDKRTGKIYRTISFKTRSMVSLNFFYELFYATSSNGTRTKIVPITIKDLLNPRVLAYWIMDDGNMITSGGTQLCTDSFTKDEVILLEQAIQSNFKLHTRLEEHGVGSGKWRIIIPVRQVTSLASIVGPYMHSSLKYKVHGL